MNSLIKKMKKIKAKMMRVNFRVRVKKLTMKTWRKSTGMMLKRLKIKVNKSIMKMKMINKLKMNKKIKRKWTKKRKKIPVPKTKTIVKKSNSNGTQKTSSKNSKKKINNNLTQNPNPKRPNPSIKTTQNPLNPPTKKTIPKINNSLKAALISKSQNKKILMASST